MKVKNDFVTNSSSAEKKLDEATDIISISFLNKNEGSKFYEFEFGNECGKGLARWLECCDIFHMLPHEKFDNH